MINRLKIEVEGGTVTADFVRMSGDNVVMIHFSAAEAITPSLYKEWRKEWKEIVTFCKNMGADNVLSFLPDSLHNYYTVLKLQDRFGFVAIGETDEGILTKLEEF